jgi:hypothetical protein
MIKQERTMDEIDAHPLEFLHTLAEKYGFSKLNGFCKINSRALGIDTFHDHITDDKIFELIVENRLIGLVYLRRDDWNYTEATYVEIPEAIEKVKRSLEEKGFLKD